MPLHREGHDATARFARDTAPRHDEKLVSQYVRANRIGLSNLVSARFQMHQEETRSP